MKHLLILFVLLTLFSCRDRTLTQRDIMFDQNQSTRYGYNQEPMYGGTTDNLDSEANKANQQFIDEMIAAFGSKEKASKSFIDEGLQFYASGYFAKAMEHFNKAWLIDPKNPEAFWGFAIVLTAENNVCEGKNMIDQAIALNLKNSTALADAGLIYTLCAVNDTQLDIKAKHQIFKQAHEFYQQAIALSPKDQYIYGSWSNTYYSQSNYVKAWEMIKNQIELGGKPNQNFLDLLRAEMSEPTR